MYEKLRESCWKANLELPALGLVIRTFGNVSAIDREAGVYAIKPSGVEYDKLRPEDIVIIRLDTGKPDGAAHRTDPSRCAPAQGDADREALLRKHGSNAYYGQK